MSVTSDPDPVDAVIDILRGADASDWTGRVPTVDPAEETAIAEKGPGDGQPPELYVWQPTNGTIENMTADGRLLDTTAPVEIQIWTLDRQQVADYRRDVVDVFGDFLDSQQGDTEFVHLEPTNARDFRAENMARRTDHFINTVELEPRQLVTA